MRKHHAISMGLAFTIAAGCGQYPSTPAVEGSAASVPGSNGETSACDGPGETAGHEHGHLMSFAERLARVGAWLEFPSERARKDLAEALGGSSQDTITVDASGAELLSGESRRLVIVDREPAEQALQAAEEGASVAIGAHVNEDDSTHLVITLLPDGDAAFVGTCHSTRHTAPLHAFHSAQHPSRPVAAVLRELLRREPRALESLRSWRAGKQPVAWQDRRPERRVLDPAEVPPEIMESLESITVAMDIPDAWHEADELLCTRVPDLGWGDCTSLHVPDPIQLSAFAKTGSVLELWLLGPAADVTSPIALVGRASAADVRATAEATQPSVLLFSTTSESTDITDVQDQPRIHSELFESRITSLDSIEEAQS